mgnify:CR=1 FL=1
MIGHDCDVSLRASSHPEFDAWRWNDYWVPLDTVIEFKRAVYEQALTELSRFLHPPRADQRSDPRAEPNATIPHDTGREAEPAPAGERVRPENVVAQEMVAVAKYF